MGDARNGVGNDEGRVRGEASVEGKALRERGGQPEHNSISFLSLLTCFYFLSFGSFFSFVSSPRPLLDGSAPSRAADLQISGLTPSFLNKVELVSFLPSGKSQVVRCARRMRREGSSRKEE